MKRLLALILLLVYLFSATELKQLLKIPVLVKHYTEHRMQAPNLGFGSFLYMHYAGDDMNDSDQDRDMQLPFKSCEESSVPHFVLHLSMQQVLAALRPQAGESISWFYPRQFRPAYYGSIWQPPKIRFA